MIRSVFDLSTYQVSAPLVHRRFKKSVTGEAASSSFWDSHSPEIPDRPGLIHGSPRLIARSIGLFAFQVV